LLASGEVLEVFAVFFGRELVSLSADERFFPTMMI